MKGSASGNGQGQARPGRPFKFGRPTQVVVLSLPEDVVTWLGSIHHDLARAIVSLFEQLQPARRQRTPPRSPARPAELVSLPGQRGLIVVVPQHLRRLRGVSLIPLPDGRAFLALDPLRGFSDLELAVIERLESERLTRRERGELEVFHEQLRGWRRTRGMKFACRSIILAEGLKTRARPARGGGSDG
jgi:hypothetical protein